MPYNAIEVNDAKLLIWVIVFSLILLFTIIVGVVAYSVFNNKENSISAKRIRTLREKATTDPIAEKRLRKIERKHKKNLKHDRVNKFLIFTLILILVSLNLFLCVIPGWMDYIKKDYIVHKGNLSVSRYTRISTITLEDGTMLSGSLGLEEGQHNLKIVYSKRTKLALWVEK